MTFDYDQNGNMTQGHGENISYNAFNKPLTIKNAGNTLQTTFTYGADLMRYKQITPQGSTIYYIDKLMEVEILSSASNYRHYLGDVAILTKTGSLNDSNPGIKYTFRDRLGGIAMLGDKSGYIAEYRGYDAYGKPRNSNWADKNPAKINSGITDRGFTDHEHLDDWQLIHMNGRGYDYKLGRFLSIDPIIQAPGNSQSINAYAYIMNNPLGGTDPTGYFSTGSRIDGGAVTSPHSTVTFNAPKSKSMSLTTTVDLGIEVTTTLIPTMNGANFEISATDRDGNQVLSEVGSLEKINNKPPGILPAAQLAGEGRNQVSGLTIAEMVNQSDGPAVSDLESLGREKGSGKEFSDPNEIAIGHLSAFRQDIQNVSDPAATMAVLVVGVSTFGFAGEAFVIAEGPAIAKMVWVATRESARRIGVESVANGVTAVNALGGQMTATDVAAVGYEMWRAQQLARIAIATEAAATAATVHVMIIE